MRRPGLLILILTVFIVFYAKDNKGVNDSIQNGDSVICGVITNKKYKKSTIEYIMRDSLISVKKYDWESKQKSGILDLNIGDRVVFLGENEDLDNMNIKGFDYGMYLKSVGINRYLMAKNFKLVGQSYILSKISIAKDYIIKTNKFLYKNLSGIVNALVVGRIESVDEEIQYIFKDSGTSHIMAISGLHIGLIANMIVLLLGKISNLKRIIAIFIIIMVYSLMVGGGSSIYRAISMMAVLYASFFLDRDFDIENVVYVLSSIFIIMNPNVIYNASFLLSFGTVLSIRIFTRYLKLLLCFNSVCISIAANILTAPIILFFYGEVSTVSIFGNIVAIPFVIIILVLDFLSIIFFNASFTISMAISQVNVHILDTLIYVLKMIGDYGVNNIVIKKMGMGAMISYFFVVILIDISLEKYFILRNKFDIVDKKNFE
ncbi:ComEC/Rec2 family competence protein [Peptostreptococcus porci]|uniref:ComEC/Rec2 family competence protein n=1 Tax=Peptostreptococcus porci TaxID=2652282 RepID=UPI002A91BAED|nr:ComEC/Rec2 family competence protein [Peptostreptococcus porci]MDY6231534.1 ComEC/Rec2 family competence protein [Peptostreptococcus porci]